MSETTALLRKANFAVERLLAQRTRRLGLTSRQSQIILAVHEAPGMTAAELGRALGIEKTTMAHVVRRMVKLKLLRQTPRNGDGRAEGNALTAQGKRKAATVVTIRNEVDKMVHLKIGLGTAVGGLNNKLEAIADLWKP